MSDDAENTETLTLKTSSGLLEFENSEQFYYWAEHQHRIYNLGKEALENSESNIETEFLRKYSSSFNFIDNTFDVPGGVEQGDLDVIFEACFDSDEFFINVD